MTARSAEDPSVLFHLEDLANRLMYAWRRSNWRLDPRRLLPEVNQVEIDRPIFLVGNQGGGLTLVSRMLRRHRSVVSVTGDFRYWSGADEIQNVMRRRLPEGLALPGPEWSLPPGAEDLAPPHSWSYGVEPLLDIYRRTAEDYKTEHARILRRIIQEALLRHGGGCDGVRFTDKSQTYALRMPYVNALLERTKPHFVLVTRDPYAACYRAAIGKAGDMARYASRMTLDRRMELCVQHWSNTMRVALADGKGLKRFYATQFESFLHDPETAVRELCDFTELSFQPVMVPSEGDTVPFGSRFRDRWYPLRENVNQRYLREAPERYLRLVENSCGPLARRLGYLPPWERDEPVGDSEPNGEEPRRNGPDPTQSDRFPAGGMKCGS